MPDIGLALGGGGLERESFNIRIRPFRVRHRDFGRITVSTNSETVFEIDGVAYAQTEGYCQINYLSAIIS